MRVAGPRQASLAGGQDRGSAAGRGGVEGDGGGCKDTEKKRHRGPSTSPFNPFLNYALLVLFLPLFSLAVFACPPSPTQP